MDGSLFMAGGLSISSASASDCVFPFALSALVLVLVLLVEVDRILRFSGGIGLAPKNCSQDDSVPSPELVEAVFVSEESVLSS